MQKWSTVEKVRRLRDEAGATTAEYAVCTGAGVGFAGVLFKVLTSTTGQKIINAVFDRVLGMLPF